jgi:hypothetical protein
LEEIELYDAIKEKITLKLVYKPPQRIRRKYLPSLPVKEYRNRWFMIGRKETMNVVMLFELDRIQKPIPHLFYLDKHLKDFEA